jgi:hypothetical protein
MECGLWYRVIRYVGTIISENYTASILHQEEESSIFFQNVGAYQTKRFHITKDHNIKNYIHSSLYLALLGWLS